MTLLFTINCDLDWLTGLLARVDAGQQLAAVVPRRVIGKVVVDLLAGEFLTKKQSFVYFHIKTKSGFLSKVSIPRLLLS